ncbi:MAG TPA: hypothetical protein VMW41_04095 [Candidatus Bathyarchaeia archaeon]|nr:hypothetical protein [Candidatus Bathyarchaeia archaeon]
MSDKLYVYASFLFFLGLGLFFLLFSQKAKRYIEQGIKYRPRPKYRRWKTIFSLIFPKDHSFLQEIISLFYVRLLGVVLVLTSLVIIWMYCHHY